MAQGEAEVPGPLSEDQPELLAPGGVTTPAVRLLFLVFIREHRLKRATMQVESYDISKGERAGWQGSVEQLIDVLTTRGLDFHRRIWSLPCSHDDSRARSAGESVRSGKS